MGGHYTEWDLDGLPAVFNFFPKYEKSGSYQFTVGIFDRSADVALADKNGKTLTQTLSVTVTP